jgi:hypothetical protein
MNISISKGAYERALINKKKLDMFDNNHLPPFRTLKDYKEEVKETNDIILSYECQKEEEENNNLILKENGEL